jgi:2-hydroxychromene-2-carboxylate isomerase
MTRTVDVCLDFRSPYADLAHAQLRLTAAKHVATIAYNPSRALELMRLVGDTPTTVECKNKNVCAGDNLRRGGPWSPSINDAPDGASP